MTIIKLLAQNPTDSQSRLYSAINEHLTDEDLNSVRFGMSYVNWGGLSLVSEALEKFLEKQDSTLSSIFGVDNGVTTADAICYAYYLQNKFAGRVQSYGLSWQYCDSEFHPKVIEFGYEDRKTFFIGSANLTNGGLASNYEASISVTVPSEDKFCESVDSAWTTYADLASRVDAGYVSNLSKKKIGSEPRKKHRDRDFEKRLGLKLPRGSKPLFEHILKSNTRTSVKHETLAKTSSLSEKPNQLFLQILKETGGGDQIQLPIATLGTFFGIGEGEAREVTFIFTGTEEVKHVHLTHFENNTHRIRLRPIVGLPRPAILLFERNGTDRFNVKVIANSQYDSVLQFRCTQQTRQGAKRWGLA